MLLKLQEKKILLSLISKINIFIKLLLDILQITLNTLILISSLIFTNINHPLAIGLILLTQTVLICLLTGTIRKTFWFSYILFLIFLGGILVLFIYVTALASNEIFKISIKLILITFLLYFIITNLFIITDYIILNNFIRNETQTLNNLYSYIPENSLTLNKLYNFPVNLITILLINYLLITLIAVVKVTKIFHGPLRTIK